MEFLPIPENYYYDLGARFGLEDAVLSRMAEFNILYDEDETGHLPPPLHARVREALLLRGRAAIIDYDGYGARDTSIRLAAQSRFRNLKPGTDIPPLHPASAKPEIHRRAIFRRRRMVYCPVPNVPA